MANGFSVQVHHLIETSRQQLIVKISTICLADRITIDTTETHKNTKVVVVADRSLVDALASLRNQGAENAFQDAGIGIHSHNSGHAGYDAFQAEQSQKL